MNEHVSHLLSAYYDGELPAGKTQQVREHLSKCHACRKEFYHIRSVSRMIRSQPEPAYATNPEKFVARVENRLAPRGFSSRQKILHFLWALLPTGLAAAWGFIQAVFITAFLVNLGLQGGLFPQVEAVLPGSSSSILISLFNLSNPGAWNEIGSILLQIITVNDPFLQGTIIYFTLQVIMGLSVCAWLVSWFLVKRRSQLQMNER